MDEDRRVQAPCWDLVGAYQGGWQVVVVQGTAGYDGMCRPQQYQAFLFVRGAVAGTLSPRPMNRRSDGALSDIALQRGDQLTAEYLRYAEEDPLCCPSRTTTVVFDIDSASRVVKPVSSTTSKPAPSGPDPLAGTSWQLVKFEGGDGTTLVPDQRAKYTIEFAAGGRLAARIDCNRGRGTWKTSGGSRLEFGPLALTRAKCPSGSLHDQIARQWTRVPVRRHQRQPSVSIADG